MPVSLMAARRRTVPKLLFLLGLLPVCARALEGSAGRSLLQGTSSAPISSGTGLCPAWAGGASGASSPACTLCLVAGSTLTAGAAPSTAPGCISLGYNGGYCTGYAGVYLFSAPAAYNSTMSYTTQQDLAVRSQSV